jgi:hypothetical protein
MAVNVKIGESKPQNSKPYPKLMEATSKANKDQGIIVLFETKGNGVVVMTVESSAKEVGYWSNAFIESCFTDFNEPLTLQNK